MREPMSGSRKKRLAILGSTGSIGTQTLDVVRKHSDRFEVIALVAGSNAELLASQRDEFGAKLAVLGARDVGGRFATGDEAILEAATHQQVYVVVK
ncbi:MAG: hypothetical protein NVSMB57_13260 [Actinomycetota bacterium]